MTEGVAWRCPQDLIFSAGEEAGGDEGTGDCAGSAAAGAEDDDAGETLIGVCFAGMDDNAGIFSTLQHEALPFRE